jgi:hypothetical protein
MYASTLLRGDMPELDMRDDGVFEIGGNREGREVMLLEGGRGRRERIMPCVLVRHRGFHLRGRTVGYRNAEKH